jgi:hypothetical protein
MSQPAIVTLAMISGIERFCERPSLAMSRCFGRYRATFALPHKADAKEREPACRVLEDKNWRKKLAR